jgi:uncharacterized protein
LVTFETSALLALFDQLDAGHHRVVASYANERGPFIVPAGILAEIAYMLESLGRGETLDLFLERLGDGKLMLDCGERDFPRIRVLVARYANLPLGFADATVVACAERHGGNVLTLDLRDFGVVAREGTITIVP